MGKLHKYKIRIFRAGSIFRGYIAECLIKCRKQAIVYYEKTITHSKPYLRKYVKLLIKYTKEAARLSGVYVAKILKICARYQVKVAKKIHHYTMHLPHQHLMSHSVWYKKWHEWKYHRHIHYAILVPYIFIVCAMVLTSYNNSVYAEQTNSSWDFTNMTDFLFDDGKIENSGSSARLKAQNYQTDADTSALYHVDESSGTTTADSTANSNTATLKGGAAFVSGNLNNAISLDGDGDYLSIDDSSSLTLSGQHTIEAWTKFNSTFSNSSNHDQGIVDKGAYRLYYDRTSGKINYEIASNSASTWTKQAGGDVNGSWDRDGKNAVRATVVDGTTQYVGLGLGTGDAEVWRLSGGSWSMIGGDGINGGWTDQTYEDVNSLIKSGNYLYAGLGTNAAGDAEVWRCDTTSGCVDWDKIGGDGINSGWAVGTYEAVLELETIGGNIYAGLGVSANDAEVWMWNGSSWTKIGGDSLNSGWTTNYEAIRSMANDGNNLYVGIGDTAGDGEVWKWNGVSWSQIGGDGISSSWATADNIEYVNSLDYFNGNLYAGNASSTGDGDIWKFNGTSWSQIGGDGLNGGWAASAFEIIASITNDGTNLYSGLGNSNGDGEVWKWNGTGWTKIGGDGLNSGFSTNQGDSVYALAYGNDKLYAGVYDSAGNGTYWEFNGSVWTRDGGGYVNQSWGGYGIQSVETSATFNEKLYIGTGVSTAGNALVWEFNGSAWNMIGGQGIKGSWSEDTYEDVFTLQQYKGALYAGLGTTANDAEVWKYDGSSWTKVGGDSVNSGWTINYEQVNSLTVYNGHLYAGLGNTANDSEVWSWDGSSWTKVGGDGLNGSWATGVNIENVLSLAVYNNKLVAGLGSTTGDAEVWNYDGSSWTKIGGDGISSSWNTNYEEVYTMRIYDDKLIAGLGNGTGDAEVWSYDGSSWTQIGGDGMSSSWDDGTYERVRSMAVYNGEFYVGIGDTAGDGEVWKWNGSSWSQIGGDSENNGWTNAVEYVSTLIDFKGKLYAGTGYSANVDATVWSIGNNAFLSSTQTSQDTEWHHVAATYNGSTMKIYIDGVEDASTSASVTIPDNNVALKIGSTYGSGGRGEGAGYFDGTIDEIRLSTTARTVFTIKPYSDSKQSITVANAVMKAGIKAYTSFTTSETLDGGSIAYRLSNDDGETWKYWHEGGWVLSASVNEANVASDINTNIYTFPVNFDGIKWQAILSGDGNQRVTINSVAIEATSDTIAPDLNADNIKAYKTNGGTEIESNDWTNGSSPYFSWDAGNDADSGILGYCLYLGLDDTANPVTTKGLFGNSLVDTGGNCQFATSDTYIDLATAGVLASPLATSNDPYYLVIKAIDKAGNIYPTTTAFNFRFDNTPPANPGYITSPSGFISIKEVTFTWPTSGGQSPSDGASGLLGLQYRINDSVWYGDDHNGQGDMSDLLANDGSYTTVETPDYANIVDGVNTIYFRSWDIAGNVTTTYTTAFLKINTNAAPSEPQSLEVNVINSTLNSFSFSWDAPATYVGEEDNLNYCYTVNTVPSESTCNYTGNGITSLSAGPYATQPGKNTLYVVAKDESNNINYDSYSSVNFTATTTAPSIVGNIDIVDVSVKVTSNWRLAITWDEPIDVGSGINSYKIYRSTNGTYYSVAGTSSSTTYIDAGLAQQTYYYYVTACDSTNNCSASSPSVSMLPTGKFTEPASIIGEPETSSITTKRARIEWTTDRASDSKVSIGTESGKYSPSEIGNSDQVSVHKIELDNLAAGTTYYFKVKWTDVDGNTGISQEYTFTTSPAPVIKEVNVTKVGLSDAIVTFTTIGAHKVNLYYGQSDSFGGLKSISTSSDEATYSIEMTGLNDGTKYYYQLSAFDSENSEYRGNIFSFTTPPRPRISNLAFQPIEGEPTSTQSITWTTNVPASSTVTYGIVGTSGTDVYVSKLETSHQVVISNLEDDSQYFLVAQSRDANGNLTVSDTHVFRTALDTRPPSISEVSIETSIRGTGAEARGQVIVSWRTDEPATSQVGYAEGSAATTFNNKTSEDTQLTTEHIVVLSNLPTSKVYSIQAISYDDSRNSGTSEPQASIIGRANESVLTTILSALERIFGL